MVSGKGLRKNLGRTISRYLTEVIVIFIGITISFLFEQWREARNNRAKEREFVESLITDLRAKKNELATDFGGFKRNIRIADSCFSFAYQDKELPNSLLRSLHRIQYSFWGFRSGSPTYNSSSATGLWQQLPDSLRRQIFTLYEVKFHEMEGSSKLATDFYLKSVEYMLENKLGTSIGVRLQDGTIIKPPNFDELRKGFSSRSFLESLKHKTDLMKFLVSASTDTIDSIDKTIGSLQSYLDKTR